MAFHLEKNFHPVFLEDELSNLTGLKAVVYWIFDSDQQEHSRVDPQLLKQGKHYVNVITIPATNLLGQLPTQISVCQT